MMSGNLSENVVLSKTTLLIERGFGLTVPQLANKHGLSTAQMTMALEECGIIKAKEVKEPTELTEREQHFIEVCAAHEIEASKLNNILADLGMEFKTGRRSTKGQKKYTIIDDYKTNEA